MPSEVYGYIDVPVDIHIGGKSERLAEVTIPRGYEVCRRDWRSGPDGKDYIRLMIKKREVFTDG